jgi:hypothetical protein
LTQAQRTVGDGSEYQGDASHVNRIVPVETGGSAMVNGGFGLTFNDPFYRSRVTTGQLVLNTRAGGTGYSAITPPFGFANAVTFRMAANPAPDFTASSRPCQLSLRADTIAGGTTLRVQAPPG